MRSVVKLSALAVWLLLAGIAEGCGEKPRFRQGHPEPSITARAGRLPRPGLYTRD